MSRETLLDRLETIIRSSPPAHAVRSALEAIHGAFGARTVTLHARVRGEDFLVLAGEIGVPEHLRGTIARIPFGKGMAGICAERREPVTVCNLQTDSSGVARPRARETRVQGAIVVPILEGEEVAGTLGVGKPEDHVYEEDEIRLLERCGALLLPLVRAVADTPPAGVPPRTSGPHHQQ